MFVGRTHELNMIHEIINTERTTVGVIYGRRRIGKSELIKKAFENEKVVVFEGLENRSKQEQIQNFLLQLHYQAGKEFDMKSVTSWSEAFLILFEYLKQTPAHIVFDEFQWMANYRSQIVSELKMVWDQYLSQIPGITLILCGSIASFMTKKVIKSNAFYGRTDQIIHLKEFKLPEIKKMLNNQGLDETIEAAMLVGGIPKYLELIKDMPSIRTGLERLAFTENGYFVDEYERIFLSHFGKNREYEAIIKALSENPYGMVRNKIAETAGIELGGGLTEHLQNLESAGFITSETPFDKGYNSRLIRYRLCDSYLRFYFAYIKPNLKRIKSGGQTNIFGQISQSASYKSWMGRSFENLCIEHTKHISEILGFSGIEYTFGPYFRAPSKNSKGVQIDLVFDRKDNVITLCEMKYTVSKIGIDIIPEVERKADILCRQFKNKTIQKVLVLKGKASKDLEKIGYFYKIIPIETFF